MQNIQASVAYTEAKWSSWGTQDYTTNNALTTDSFHLGAKETLWASCTLMSMANTDYIQHTVSDGKDQTKFLLSRSPLLNVNTS